MPALPLPATDTLQLADWLELLALFSDDKNASLGDLERALRRGSIVEQADDQRTQEVVAELCGQVMSELRERARAAAPAYPYVVGGSELTLNGGVDDHLCYLFCLLLSVLVPKMPKKKQTLPRRLFEDLASVASAKYLGGEGLRFASPRTDIPKPFGKAVDHLCSRLGEGEQYKNQPSLSSKDAHLDVVAWKHFPDGLPGKLVLFGQCASGSDWKTKLSELQPHVFCGNWMLEVPPSGVLRAFFMPFCAPRKQWNVIVREGGVFFDRCRLAHWVHSHAGLPFRDELSAWVRETTRVWSDLEKAA